MKRLLLLLSVVAMMACGKKVERKGAASEIYGCDDGSSDGSTDGPHQPDSKYGNYALSGCDGGDGSGDGAIGSVGKLPEGTISPGSEGDDEPLCLTDQCSDANPDVPMSTYVPPDIMNRVKAIYNDPNKTSEEKAEALKELLKEVIAEHAAGAPGFQPDLGSTAMALHNLIEKMANDEDKSGTAVAYFYTKYVAEEESTSDSETKTTTYSVSAQVGAKIGAKGSLPGAAKNLVGGASADAEAGVTAGVNHSFTKESKHETVSHEPPTTKERIVICIVKDNGQIVAGDLNLRDPGDGPDHGIRIEQNEDIRKKRSEDDERRREERLRRIREKEAEFYASAKVVFLVKSIRGDAFVELTPDLINSYNFVYGWFPADFATRKANHLTALNALQKAVKTRDLKRATVKVKLQQIVNTLSGTDLSTATLTKIPAEILEAKAQVCPEGSIEKEKQRLQTTIDSFVDFRNLYLSHVNRIGDLEPTDVLTAHFDKEAKFLDEGRAKLKEAKDLVDICGQFNQLHSAVTLRIEQNRIKKFDAEAIALTDAVMAEIVESNRRVLAADRIASMDRFSIELAQAIAEQTMLAHLTEARAQAAFAQATLTDDVLPAIATDSQLTQGDKDALTVRVTERVGKEITYLGEALTGDGLKGMILSRFDGANSDLKKIRQLIRALDPVKRDVVLSSWRGVVVASGLAMEEQCLAPTTALDERCWQVHFALAEASEIEAEKFDAGLADLGFVIAKFLQSL